VLTPYVFHRPDGSEIKSFKKLWRTATVAAGLPGKLLHDFRRTAVRTFERSGISRSAAMAMVGHKTESIHKQYAIVDPQMLNEAAAKLEAWSEPAQPTKGRVRRFAKS
jgi:integrase